MKFDAAALREMKSILSHAAGVFHLRSKFRKFCQGFISLKRPHTCRRQMWGLFWQRMRDSNPRERSQSPVCYRYTNPLCRRFSVRHGYYYTQLLKKVKQFFPFSQLFFMPGKSSLPGILRDYSPRFQTAKPEPSAVFRQPVYSSASHGKGLPFRTSRLMYRKVSASP